MEYQDQLFDATIAYDGSPEALAAYISINRAQRRRCRAR